MLNSNIGFLIWGVLDGFQKDILHSNDAIQIEEIRNFPNDKMRQICNETRGIGYFYGIQKTDNYTCVSVFNGDLRDRVGRGAYIVITLFVKKGNSFRGEVIKTLRNLMDFYIKKQGDSLTIAFTREMIEEQLMNLNGVNEPYANSLKFDTQGVFQYKNDLDIEKHFNNPTIEGYNEVLFFNDSKPDLTSKLTKYNLVKEFKKYTQIKFLNYDSSRHSFNLNGQQIAGTISGTFTQFALPNDAVKITDTKTKKEINILVDRYNQEKDLTAMFYVPSKPETQERKKDPIKGILITCTISMLAILIAIGVYYWPFSIKESKNPEPPNISTGIYHGEDSLGSNSETTDPTVEKGYQKTIYTTLELINSGCYVFARKKFTKKPYIQMIDGTWWQGTCKNDSKEVKDNNSINDIENHFHKASYYKAEDNKLKFSADNISWETLKKNDQLGIYEFFVSKGFITESNVSSNESSEKVKGKKVDSNQNSGEQTVKEPKPQKVGMNNGGNKSNCEIYNSNLKTLKQEKSECYGDINCMNSKQKEIEDLKNKYKDCK